MPVTRVAEEPSAETYDPKSGRWTTTGPMAAWRASSSATLLGDGRVLVAGGFGDTPSSDTELSAELYDPKTRSWIATASMGTRRVYGLTATLLHDGRVLLAGGEGLPELYQPTTGTWSTAAPGILSLGGQTATLLPDGTVLFAGGWDGVTPIAASQIYDPTLSAWTPASPMHEPRVSAQTVLLADGRVLVVAGASNVKGDLGLTSAELYDPGETR